MHCCLGWVGVDVGDGFGRWMKDFAAVDEEGFCLECWELACRAGDGGSMAFK